MSDKIQEHHLQRTAYVYVRQSTMQQVRYHKEGQLRQYSLEKRAQDLGFRKTIVIDEDLGRSGSGRVDRLLLGLKGTMSEFELSLFRQRARQAFEQKIARGYVMWEVPVGFVRTEDDRIEKIPDLQVQEAIESLFSKFRELGSARQALLWYRDEQFRCRRQKQELRVRKSSGLCRKETVYAKF